MLPAYARRIASLNAQWQISFLPSFCLLNLSGSWESPQGLPRENYAFYKWKNGFLKYGNGRKTCSIRWLNPTTCLEEGFSIVGNHCAEKQHIPPKSAVGLKWCWTLGAKLWSASTCPGNCNRLLYKIAVLFSNFLEKFFNVLMVFFTCASLFYNLCLT